MSFAEERSQAVEDVVHAWTYGSNCLLYEAGGGADVHVGGESQPPRTLSHTEAVQTIHAQFVLVALDADPDRLRAAGQACYQTAAGLQRSHPREARAYVRASDLCDRAADLVVAVGADDDPRARRRLLAVAEHDTTMATSQLDPEVARRARHALELALSASELQAPEPGGPLHYPGPSYDPATGRHRIGVTSTGETAHWRLNNPGTGMECGLICGPAGSGKSNFLRMVLIEAAVQPSFALWLADPGGRHDFPAVVTDNAARYTATHRGTVELLRGAVAVIADRARRGPLPDPDRARPGIVLAVEDGHLVFADDLEATRLAERIVAVGGRFGVGLVVTAPAADLVHFGGSRSLRTGLARTNRFPLGPGGRRMLNVLQQSR